MNWIERSLRREWWFNHGCPVTTLYGDDGEMQCGKCRIDFAREPIDTLRIRVTEKRFEYISKDG